MPPVSTASDGKLVEAESSELWEPQNPKGSTTKSWQGGTQEVPHMGVLLSRSDISLGMHISLVSPPHHPSWPLLTHHQWKALVLCVEVVEAQVDD